MLTSRSPTVFGVTLGSSAFEPASISSSFRNPSPSRSKANRWPEPAGTSVETSAAGTDGRGDRLEARAVARRQKCGFAEVVAQISQIRGIWRKGQRRQWKVHRGWLPLPLDSQAGLGSPSAVKNLPSVFSVALPTQDSALRTIPFPIDVGHSLATPCLLPEPNFAQGFHSF
jgi:hypothetical protein